jgi:hypothetical protein
MVYWERPLETNVGLLFGSEVDSLWLRIQSLNPGCKNLGVCYRREKVRSLQEAGGMGWRPCSRWQIVSVSGKSNYLQPSLKNCTSHSTWAEEWADTERGVWHFPPVAIKELRKHDYSDDSCAQSPGGRVEEAVLTHLCHSLTKSLPIWGFSVSSWSTKGLAKLDLELPSNWVLQAVGFQLTIWDRTQWIPLLRPQPLDTSEQGEP